MNEIEKKKKKKKKKTLNVNSREFDMFEIVDK